MVEEMKYLDRWGNIRPEEHRRQKSGEMEMTKEKVSWPPSQICPSYKNLIPFFPDLLKVKKNMIHHFLLFYSLKYVFNRLKLMDKNMTKIFGENDKNMIDWFWDIGTFLFGIIFGSSSRC